MDVPYIYIYIYISFAQCSTVYVGLAQARPNNIVYNNTVDMGNNWEGQGLASF